MCNKAVDAYNKRMVEQGVFTQEQVDFALKIRAEGEANDRRRNSVPAVYKGDNLASDAGKGIGLLILWIMGTAAFTTLWVLFATNI